MQVILSEAEYNNLVNKEKKLEGLMKQIEECFIVSYDDDGDIFLCKAPTFKGLNVNIDKVLELGNLNVKKAAKEVGIVGIDYAVDEDKTAYIIKVMNNAKEL